MALLWYFLPKVCVSFARHLKSINTRQVWEIHVVAHVGLVSVPARRKSVFLVYHRSHVHVLFAKNASSGSGDIRLCVALDSVEGQV